MTDLVHLPRRRIACAAAALASMLGLWPTTPAAQALPDAGVLLRETRREPAPLPPKSVPILPAEQPASAGGPRAGGIRFNVSAFRIQGATLVPEPLLQAAIAPWLNRPIQLADVEQAAQALTDVYRRQGWLARSQVPPQDVVGGVVTLQVIEARLGELRIDDAGLPLRFDRARITRTLTARQQPGQPLRLDDLERAVALLNDTPGLSATAVLAAGRLPGETDLVLKPVDRPRWAGNVQLDNQSARATGSTGLSVNLALANLGGTGDQLLFGAHTTGEGNQFVAFGYSLPLGHDGWRAGVDTSALLRSSGRNASLTLAADRRDFLNRANGQVVSDKRLSGFSAALAGDLSDGFGGAGLTLWGANLGHGRVDLSAQPAHAAADEAGPRSAGSYSRLGWNLGRLQQTGERSALWLVASGQVASKNLDSAEKFGLGGAYGVRAYPSLEGSGDSGWLVSVEWRYSATPTLQWLAFYDHGKVRINQDASFAGAAALNHVALEGAGIGLNWVMSDRISLRATLAQRIGSNPLASAATGKDSDGSLERMRLWLGVTAYF
jgi:hemolysin activation/secretion protein